MRVQLRPTVAADLAQVTHETLPIRIRAITALVWDDYEQRDRVLGVGGIGYREDGVIIGFASINDEFRRYPAALHRAGLAMMRVIRESGVPQVIALADRRIAAAERWLVRLGFEAVDEGGVRLFVWNAVRSRHG
ncbi:hypothetical protein ACVWW6_006025 [Bradyrhizobium sp. USDA 3311]